MTQEPPTPADVEDLPTDEEEEEEEEEGPELRPFRIQLVDVHAAELQGRLESTGATDVAPAIETSLLRTDLGDDRRSFSCRLQVKLRFAEAPRLATVSFMVQGDFHSAEDIRDEDYIAFVAYTPVALLWPYARGYADQIYRMLGMSAPPLPTLDALNIVMEPEVQLQERGE